MSQVAKLAPVSKEILLSELSALELFDGITLDINMTCRQASEFMLEKDFLSLGVVNDQGMLHGFYSIRFFLHEIMYKGIDLDTPLIDVIFKNPLEIHLEDPLLKVLNQCNHRPEAVFPVLGNDGKVIHNFWIKDIITFLCKVFKKSLDGLGSINEKNFYDLIPEDDYKEEEPIEGEIKILNLVSPLRRVVGSRLVVSENNLSVAEVINNLVEEDANMFILSKFGIDMVGVVTDRILFQNFYDKNIKDLYELPIKDYLGSPPELLLEEHLVGNALSAFGANNSRRMIVVDRDLVPIKVLEPVDLIRYLNSGILGDLWLQLKSSPPSQNKNE